MFHYDVTGQFGWYFDEAGEELAWRFYNATDQTLLKLSKYPGVGRLRKFCHRSLQNLRSFQVERPFQKIPVFYRTTENKLIAWRLMHGMRNLPRRLTEP
jgi:plasmid stabilization system protein ParE